MTTIAYSNGVIAADSMASQGDLAIYGVIKIARSSNGHLGGSAGDAGFNAAWSAWVEGSCQGERPKATRDETGTDVGLVIYPDGRIELSETGGTWSPSAPYIAIGSGRGIAMGAMLAGADVVEAVRAAIHHDCWSGGEITVLRR